MESQKQFAEYMRKISQLYQDFEADRISRESAILHLNALKIEHKQLIDSQFDEHIVGEDSMIPSRTTQTYRVKQELTKHELDFKCQCAFCVRHTTPTATDLELLRGLKIVWTSLEK